MQWKCADRILEPDKSPLIMGILNVTPDSFSDGGRYIAECDAVTRGLEMVEEGADIIDVGGESTRPGAPEVSVEEEIERVVPVIESLVHQTEAIVSVDTTKAEVARSAIKAGAGIINDVSALTRDSGMSEVAVESGAGIVLMHMVGTPRTMQEDPRYDDVVTEVLTYLESRISDLVASGIEKDRVAIDPGIGFGKTVEHNLALLANLERFSKAGVPVVAGLSRKSFLGVLTGREVDDRLAGSLAGLVYSVLNGAHIVRVHDVKESVDAMKIAVALKQEKGK
jgi:dihydropteroate synthase